MHSRAWEQSDARSQLSSEIAESQHALTTMKRKYETLSDDFAKEQGEKNKASLRSFHHPARRSLAI